MAVARQQWCQASKDTTGHRADSKDSVIDLLASIPEGEPVVEEEAIETLGVRSATVIRRPRPGRAPHLRNLLRHPFRALMLSQYSTTTIACLEDDPSSAVPIRNTFTGSESARNEI